MDRCYFQFQAVADMICKTKEYGKNYAKLLKVMKKVRLAYGEAKIERLLQDEFQKRTAEMAHK